MIISATERVVLRHLHIFDATPLNAVFGDSDVMKYGDGIKTPDEVLQWIQDGLENCFRNWGFGPFAVVRKRDKEVLGYCGLFYFPDINGRSEVEVGFRLAKKYWGEGYATESASAVCRYAFEELGLKRIIALIDPANTGSVRVAEKLGMRKESEAMLEGYSHPDFVFSISAAAFFQRSIQGEK